MTQFKDLIFKDNFGGINAHHTFDNDWEISVAAGRMAYSTPREDGLDSTQFSAFEVAIFDPHGNFATGEILQIDDDVAGWQGREDINNIIEMIIAQ